MHIRFKVLIGFIVVTAISATTMSAGTPHYIRHTLLPLSYPRLQFTASLFQDPCFSFLHHYQFSAFLISAIPLFKAEKSIGKSFKVISVLIGALSVLYLMASFVYGYKYQGLTHTLVICIYNAIFIVALYKLYLANMVEPSLNKAFVFRLTFFVWLGWCAFPWLGELL